MSQMTMGLLNKLFGKAELQKPESIKERVTKHEENWVTYLSTVDDDLVGSFISDVGFATIAPDASRSNLVIFSLDLNEKTENGLPSRDERASLDSIETAIIDDLSRRHAAVNPGHLYCENKLDVFFYAGSLNGIGETIALRMTDFENYKYALSFKDDPEWETYFELLYPSPIQMQSIGNRQVIENMVSHGDSLQAERAVDHWICFKSVEDRDHFIRSIDHMGFDILSQDYEEDHDEPFSLNISRTDHVDPDSVDQYVLELWQIAQDCNGRYDGWGALIVREDGSSLSH